MDTNTIIGMLVGGLGIVTAIAAWAFPIKRDSAITVLYKNTNIIGSSTPALPENVTIRYRSETVSVVSKSNLTFWNSGFQTIKNSDLLSTDPIRFQLLNKEAYILQVKCQKITRKQIGFSCDNENEGPFSEPVNVTFDFLDPKDGFSLEILHNSRDDGVILGTIMGIPKGITVKIDEEYNEGGGLRFVFAIGITGTILGTIFSILSTGQKYRGDWVGYIDKILPGLMIEGGLLLMFLAVWALRQNRLAPKKLRA